MFFPEDVQRPRCQMGQVEEVKKIVIKVKVSTPQQSAEENR